MTNHFDETIRPPFETAFPIATHDGGLLEYGMSLRDYFAAKAMQGFISNPSLGNLDKTQKDEYSISEAAYAVADAMMRARKAKS